MSNTCYGRIALGVAQADSLCEPAISRFHTLRFQTFNQQGHYSVIGDRR